MVPLPIALNVLIISLFLLLGILECARLRRCHPGVSLETALGKAPYLYVLIPLSLMLLLATVTLMVLRMKRPAFFWSLPLWLEYHFNTLTWGSILALFAFTFGLASALAVRSRHRERWKVVFAAVLFVSTIQVVQWNYTRPVAPRLEERMSPDGMVSQTSPVSCAAASGATIARIFGLDKTEREMAELYGTSMMGTSAAQVVYGMRALGISSRKVEVPGLDPGSLEPPAMIFVDNPFIGPESHAVVYLGDEGGKVRIWDPIMGLLSVEKADLPDLWRGRGVEFNLE